MPRRIPVCVAKTNVIKTINNTEALRLYKAAISAQSECRPPRIPPPYSIVDLCSGSMHPSLVSSYRMCRKTSYVRKQWYCLCFTTRSWYSKNILCVNLYGSIIRYNAAISALTNRRISTSPQHPVRRRMAGIIAAEFEEIYGELTRSEYSEFTRECALSKVLARREPPVIVPDGVLRVWLRK